ncbi:MAG: undecaprenyl-diphosphatase UppP [Clostridia bacterium]|nr:undecaprenyl-diphosphatase UppP [Clostridia bacterium]
MDVIQAIVLGLVQGLGEFLPISSSAHLVLFPWFFRWPDPGLTFSVALHLGTLIAVVVYFWHDIINLVVSGFTRPCSNDGRMLWYLAVASVPGALSGLLLEEQAETVFRSPLLVALALALMGVILWWADRRGRKIRRIEDINLTDSILVGLSQALAIIPGVSRSGITMSAGLMTGMQRETAARFSFLMSIPIITGAALLTLKDLSLRDIDISFVLGVIVAAIVGFLAIKYLLQYLRRGSYLLFTWYRIALAALVVIVYLYRS